MNEDRVHFLVLMFFLVCLTIPICILSYANILQQQRNELLYQNYSTQKLIQEYQKLEAQNTAKEKNYLLGNLL